MNSHSQGPTLQTNQLLVWVPQRQEQRRGCGLQQFIWEHPRRPERERGRQGRRLIDLITAVHHETQSLRGAKQKWNRAVGARPGMRVSTHQLLPSMVCGYCRDTNTLACPGLRCRLSKLVSLWRNTEDGELSPVSAGGGRCSAWELLAHKQLKADVGWGHEAQDTKSMCARPPK